MKIGQYQVGLPAALVAATAMVCITLVYLWGPDDARSAIAEWLVRGAAVVGPFLGAALQRAQKDAAAERAEDTAAEPAEDEEE